MKKVISAMFFSLTLMCSASVLAASPTPTPTPTQEPLKTYTYDDAVKYMYQNSNVIKSQEDNIKSLTSTKGTHRMTRKKLDDAGYAYSQSDVDTYLLGTGFVEYADDIQINIAKRSLEQSKYQLEMNLMNKFYGYLNAEKKVDVAKVALDNAKENERIATAKNEKGLVGKIEAQSFAVATIEANNNYENAKRSANYALEELKKAMAYPAETELKVTGTFERKPMNDTPLESAYAKSHTSNTMLNLNDQLSLQRKQFNTYSSLYSSNQHQYQEQKWALSKAEADYSENVYQLRLDITSAYNQMLDAYEGLNYIDKAVELMDAQQKAQKTSYEIGMSTASEYIKAVQEYDSLKLQQVDAEIGAYLASQAYEVTYHTFEKTDDKNTK